MTISRLRSNDLRQPVTGNFTNTATGTGSGFKYVTFTTNGTLNVDSGGTFWVFLIGSGSGGDFGGYANMGSGGNVIECTNFYIPSGSHAVTVGASVPCSNTLTDALGKPSKIGSLLDTGFSGKGGRGAGFNGSNAIDTAYTTTITGSAQSFGAGQVATPAANTGQGSYSYWQNPSGSGIVIVRATL